jgi:hypothetical protein
MSAILNVLFGSGGSSLVTLSITAANSGPSGAYYYYGWSTYSNGAPAARQYIPGTTMGSATGTLTFRGQPIDGVYSNSTSNYNIATRYAVLLDGTGLGASFVTGLIINGTSLTYTGFYDDGTSTAYYFDVVSGTTLITASSTVSIS